MGVFQELVTVINRTSKPLNVRFDGQDFELKPNYNVEGELIKGVVNQIPSQTVIYAKSQNVLMGSEDPFDPSEFVVLIGAVAKKGQKQKDDISYCEQSNEPTRVRLKDYLGDDPMIKEIRLGGRQTPAARRGETTGPTTPFEIRQS